MTLNDNLTQTFGVKGDANLADGQLDALTYCNFSHPQVSPSYDTFQILKMYLSYDTVPKNAVILSIPDTVSQILPHPDTHGVAMVFSIHKTDTETDLARV